MKLAYVLDQPTHGSGAIHALHEGLPVLGHTFEPFDRDTKYDCVIICSAPHPTSDWANRLNIPGDARLAFIDWTEYGWQHSSLHSRFDFYTGLTDAAFAWDSQLARSYRPVRELLRGRSFLYFSRELFKKVLYPPGYYPMDPIDCNGPKVPLVSEEEFLARKQFLFVSQNDNHPHRKQLADMMLSWAVSKNVPTYIVCSGINRLSLEDYHAGLSRSQVSVAYDGYASSYQQPEILRRCALVRNEPSRLRPFQLGDGCIEYEVDLVMRKTVRLESTNLIQVLDWLWRNPRAVYQTYCKGHEFVHKYHTSEKVAQYFVDRIAGHDWSRPTSWDIAPLAGIGEKPWLALQAACSHRGGFTVYAKIGGNRSDRVYQCSCGKVMRAEEMPAEELVKWFYRPAHHEIPADHAFFS